MRLLNASITIKWNVVFIYQFLKRVKYNFY